MINGGRAGLTTGRSRTGVIGGRHFSGQNGRHFSGFRHGHHHGRHHRNRFAFFDGGFAYADTYPYYYEPDYLTCERRRVRVNRHWVVRRICWRPY
jgi:hypothetical protein